MKVQEGGGEEEKAMSTSSTIIEPRLLARHPSSTDGIEVSLHTLPKQLLREFRHVFRDEYLSFPGDARSGAAFASGGAVSGGDGMLDVSEGQGGSDGTVLLALPTNQRAREDLVAVGDHIEAEKDRLLNVVRSFLFCGFFE